MASVVELPRLTDTMEEGVIAQWLVAVGDKVKRGQVIAEIETDKATMEFESFDSGYVLQLLVSEGETLEIGAAIAVFGKKGEDAAPALTAWRAKSGGASAAVVLAEPASAEPARAAAAAPSAEPASAVAKEPVRGSGERIPASPLARRLARENDLALAAIPGSGPHGRVIKADVLRAAGASRIAASTTPAVAKSRPKTAGTGTDVDHDGRPYASFEDRTIKLTPMRKTIVKRMTQSKREIPHINLTIPIFMDRAAAMRTELNGILSGVKISFNDILIYAVAKALRVHPRINAAYTPQGIIEYGDVHVGVAVAVEGGLVVPVVRYTDQKTIKRISLDIRDLGKRAKDKSLRPEEMKGSTFTVSNLGMFGIEAFTAVINPGEGAILAVGRIADEAVVEGGAVVIRKVMRATLCSDHRVFDGADNARFLATLKKLLEAPMSLFT
ncbi:MAG TPA: 2-oxo acid dehydrogenase subunit E2 [Nannocystis exedens]|nr:2-oxo acid dehydrogenase subunit E2 [Nannocystis exedens]